MTLEESDREGWVAVSYSLVIAALVAFATYAIIYTRYFSGKGVLENTKGFITARGSQSMLRIGWSFYAGSVGAWCITAPSSYAIFSGWVGLVAYSIACGSGVIVVAYLGTAVKRQWPEANSLGDFVMLRFGPTARLITVIIALFTMSLFMTVEFTTIGGLFQDFVGTQNYPIIIVVAVLTTAYTAYGGLLVSIVTDQVQAIFSLVLLLTVSIVVASTFRQDLPPDFGPLKDLLGPNGAGYSACFTLPLCLLAAAIFNEGTWQRVWAASDDAALKGGAWIAGGLICIAVFTYGMFGFLAAWGGLIDLDSANPNLYMFQVFRSHPGEGQATVSKWVHVAILVLGATMNQSAIDSLLNGLTATLSSSFLRREPIAYARACVVLLAVPTCLVALRNLSILQIFITSNMLGVSCFPGLLIGGFWTSPLGRRVVSESAFCFSCVATILGTIVYGTVRHWDGNVGSSVQKGAEYGWVSQPYDWDYFVVALGGSLCTLFLFGGASELLFRRGVQLRGISEILVTVPGLGALLQPQQSAPAGVSPIHSACMACLGRTVDGAAVSEGHDEEKGAAARTPSAGANLKAQPGPGQADSGVLQVLGAPAEHDGVVASLHHTTTPRSRRGNAVMDPIQSTIRAVPGAGVSTPSNASTHLSRFGGEAEC